MAASKAEETGLRVVISVRIHGVQLDQKVDGGGKMALGIGEKSIKQVSGSPWQRALHVQ